MVDINVTNVGEATVVRLSGRVAGEKCRDVYKKVQELLSAEKLKLALDMSKVNYVDSEGIGMLVGATILVRERGTRLKIFKIAETVKQVLITTNLNRALNLYDSEEAALADGWEYSGYRSFR